MYQQISFSTDLKSSTSLEGFNEFSLLHLSVNNFGYMLDLSKYSESDYIFMRIMVSIEDSVRVVFEYSNTRVNDKLHYKIEYDGEKDISYIYSVWNETGKENILASQSGYTIFDNILNKVSIKFSNDFKSFMITLM